MKEVGIHPFEKHLRASQLLQCPVRTAYRCQYSGGGLILDAWSVNARHAVTAALKRTSRHFTKLCTGRTAPYGSILVFEVVALGIRVVTDTLHSLGEIIIILEAETISHRFQRKQMRVTSSYWVQRPIPRRRGRSKYGRGERRPLTT